MIATTNRHLAELSQGLLITDGASLYRRSWPGASWYWIGDVTDPDALLLSIRFRDDVRPVPELLTTLDGVRLAQPAFS